MNPTVRWEHIPAGTPVYDRDDEKLGQVTFVDPRNRYLRIGHSWLFLRDLYIPVDCISLVHEDGLRLSLSKEDLHDPRYADVPPPGSSVSAHGGATWQGFMRRVTIPTETSKAPNLTVPLIGEEAVVRTPVKGVDKVRIGKDAYVDTKTVSNSVRKE